MSSHSDERIQWLHRQIFENRFPNAFRISEKFGISHRQAQRDIDYLRSEMKAPLKYDSHHKGFYYSEHFSLPSYSSTANDEGYSQIISKIKSSSSDELGKSETFQMQIPYSAKIGISSKLGILELKDFITAQESRGVFICEFHNPDLFLGMLFSLDADVKIFSPDWLRKRAIEAAERILKNNSKNETETK